MLVLLALTLVTGSLEQVGTIPATSENGSIRSSGGVDQIQVIPISDKELAEKNIAGTEEQIRKVNVIITWFKGNASTSSDVKFVEIVARREVAMSHLSTAKDYLSAGDYTHALSSSKDAYESANETYNDALERQSLLTEPHCTTPTLPSNQIILIILIGILPLLLTILLYSLMQTISSPLMKSFHLFIGPISGFTVLASVWIVYPVLLIGANIANIQFLKPWTVIMTVLWAGLILGLIILSVLAIGIVVFAESGSWKGKKKEIHDTKESKRPLFEKIILVIKIAGMILLILIMPTIISWGFSISRPIMCI